MMYPRYRSGTTAPPGGLVLERRLVEHLGLVQNTNVPLPGAGKITNFIDGLSAELEINKVRLNFNPCELV